MASEPTRRWIPGEVVVFLAAGDPDALAGERLHSEHRPIGPTDQVRAPDPLRGRILPRPRGTGVVEDDSDRRRAISSSTRSPPSWPRQSFTVLRRSRSRNRTASFSRVRIHVPEVEHLLDVLGENPGAALLPPGLLGGHLALDGVAHGSLEEPPGELALDEAVLGPGPERAVRELPVLAAREDDDGHGGGSLEEGADRVETAGIGELQVEERPEGTRRLGGWALD